MSQPQISQPSTIQRLQRKAGYSQLPTEPHPETQEYDEMSSLMKAPRFYSRKHQNRDHVHPSSPSWPTSSHSNPSFYNSGHFKVPTDYHPWIGRTPGPFPTYRPGCFPHLNGSFQGHWVEATKAYVMSTIDSRPNRRFLNSNRPSRR